MSKRGASGGTTYSQINRQERGKQTAEQGGKSSQGAIVESNIIISSRPAQEGN